MCILGDPGAASGDKGIFVGKSLLQEKYSCAMAKLWLKENDVRKRQAQKIACRLRTDESWSRYKSIKNQANEVIKLAKSSYYKNSWKGRNLIMAKTPQLTRIDALKIGDVSKTPTPPPPPPQK